VDVNVDASDNSDNSINDSYNTEINTTFELTIGDVQLNNAALSASVSGVSVGGVADCDCGPATGDISGASFSDNQGMFISNNNTGVASISNAQNINVGTVNLPN
jgi:hypothetical protein